MQKPLFLHYTYYHCTKNGNPSCPQRCVSGQELENQIADYIASIAIAKRFKEWALKYLHELHEEETASLDAVIRSQRKAHERCLAEIQGLVNLKTSAGNQDGNLLSDTEYAKRRGELMKEKAALEELLNDAGRQMKKQLKLSEQVFEFAATVQKKFAEGDPKTKKEILSTIGSNLTLKDKKLIIEAREPFFILKNMLCPQKLIPSPIEPEKIQAVHGRKVPSLFMRPYVLGDADDVRTLQHVSEKLAKSIYRFFGNACRSQSFKLSDWWNLYHWGEHTDCKN